ncbi:GNAT family N-acetyltransferase [Paenibacillus chondroitinus]|uniref:GNAT family N-acetyltransferase n=1 Tax=Paenibacillus chondroitinus TaxID=59842 RepID=A0ABU6D6L1_9BACL|nr:MULTISPECIES: GNAT family N-acetyltransferase [Paenibacillus]MCY9662525.1 GNAT family N-acetyltransferase [Paenibacillus anseongense]MEB4793360.1 GNAT family N-acetyltransferase [Paenibacillus chondroitinus]
MKIRPIANDLELKAAFNIEMTVYTKESAASWDAFQMRMEVFGRYFLVAESDSSSEQLIVGVANGVQLNHSDLSDESIKQGVDYDPNGRYFCLLTIAVHPDYQRQGIAANLLQEMIRKTKDDGLKGIILMCEKHLISFYERNGFRYIGPSASEHGGVQWYEMNLIWQ